MIWLPVTIEGFEHYLVSYCAKVKNTRTGNYMNPWFNEQGYLRLRLSNGKNITNQYLHRLVALAHIPNPENKPEVNHKDRIRSNCHGDNLEHMTHAENMAYIHAADTIPEYLNHPDDNNNNNIAPF